jgi:acyl-CoA hydrolase
MTALAPRSPSESFTTTAEYVLPVHANALGFVFGGQVMAWMDLCAAICAERHTRSVCVTAGIDELSFEQPIQVGQVVKLNARVTATFRTSLEIEVKVEGEDARKGRTWPCVSAFLTFVSVGPDMKPTACPPLLLTTDEEHTLAGAAADRRARRLSTRQKQS